MKKNKHIGSNFDDFLKDQQIYNDVVLGAFKKIIIYELKETMKKDKLSKTELAKRLGTSRSGLERLLDPKNYSITLLTIAQVAQVLGKSLDINFN